jgi:allantoinase
LRPEEEPTDVRLLVIRSTRVMLPAAVQPAVLHVSGERIVRIAPYDAPLPVDAELHDVGSLAVMPGIVDTHVHINDPGRSEWEGFETGTGAAAAGGVTTVVDMPLNSIPATTDVAALEAKRAATRGRIHVDVAFWGGVVPGNARDIGPLWDEGVSGFKCFLVPSGVDEFQAVDERDLREALPILAARGAPLLAHAESPGALVPIPEDAPRAEYATWLRSRPPTAELDAIRLLIGLCGEFRTPVHIVHLAAAEAVAMISAAKADGLPLTVESCPHYLTFCAEDVPSGATPYKCAPPIRDRENREALWRALVDGSIDFVATDHSPSPPAMKPPDDFPGAWGGIASLELSLPVLWTEASRRHIPVQRLAHWLCAGPASLAGLSTRKGTLAEGMDADVVIWDPDADFAVDPARLHQRHKMTPYAGCRLRGRVRETYVRGQLVYREGAARDAVLGAGTLIRRA